MPETTSKKYINYFCCSILLYSNDINSACSDILHILQAVADGFLFKSSGDFPEETDKIMFAVAFKDTSNCQNMTLGKISSEDIL